MRSSACIFAAALALGPGPLRANGLEELRLALEKLRAREPVRVRITQETSGQFNDEGDIRTRQGRANLIAEDGGAGQPLRLIYDDALLTQAAREQAGRQNAAGPGDALRDLSAVRVLALLRAAAKLLDDLKEAELLRETSETREGRAIRILELQLKAPRGIDMEKGFTVMRNATIWIDTDGVPLMAEIRTHTEVRRLIFKVRFDTTEKTIYGIAAQRLIARRRENESRWKAWILAEGSNRSVTRVDPL